MELNGEERKLMEESKKELMELRKYKDMNEGKLAKENIEKSKIGWANRYKAASRRLYDLEKQITTGKIEEINKAWYSGLRTMNEMVNEAELIRMDLDNIRSTLKELGISEKEITEIKRSIFKEYVPLVYTDKK